MSVPEYVSDLWNGPDYSGQFNDLLSMYDSRGDYGGDALRYAIFSTLNDGPSNPAYAGRLQMARKLYGLTGPSSSPGWDGRTGDSNRVLIDQFVDDVVQPTVGSWLSLTSWLYWFKVGFVGFLGW